MLNIAPFAYRDDNPHGRTLVFRWEETREVHRMVLYPAGNVVPPSPEAMRVAYWRCHWPEHRTTLADLESGGWAGWKRQDDWFNGQWVDADIRVENGERSWVISFAPLAEREFPALTDFNVTFRQTLKLCVTLPEAEPQMLDTEIFTDTPTVVRDLFVETGCGQEPVWDGEIEVYHGILLDAVHPSPADPRLRIRVTCSRPGPLSHDHTIITVRSSPSSGMASFSFRPEDAQDDGVIWAPHPGVLVSPAERDLRWSPALVNGLCREKTVYDRITEEPEQSLERAMTDQPPKRPMHFVIGCEGGREKFGVAPNGDVFGHVGLIRHVSGRDTSRLGWEGRAFALRFGWDRYLRAARSIDRGILPVHQATFCRGGLDIEQTAFAVPLTQSILDGPIQGDDPVIAMVRLVFTNRNDHPVEICQPMASMLYREAGSGISRGRQTPDAMERLSLQRDLVRAAGDPAYIRMAVDAGEDGAFSETETGLIYRTTLPAGASRAVVLKVVFDGRLQEEDVRSLQEKTFDREHDEVRRYWQAHIDAGAEILTPEPDLDDFYRAHLTHILINDDREVGSDRLMGRVSSFHYGNFSNEAVMQITDLDRRGLHEEARRHLDTYLHYQSTVALPGNFTGQDGVFYGSGGYEHGDYNQHHGWVLWGLAEHYRYTGDRDWLLRIADHLVSGCDWVLRERETTRRTDRNGQRLLEYGFLPAGTLEDVRDYYYWLTTNAMTCRGLTAAAAALQEVGHHEAPRLVEGAHAYREDVRAGFHEAMIRSPMVRLRDGTAVPHHPSRLYLRGRDFGWIREVLEGSINLIGPVIEPDSEESTWILKDYEDNRYLDAPYNFPLEDFEREWFSCGGFSMQPNLVYFPPPYLLRDQVEHFLRAFFNGFAACWRPELRAMTEHPLPTLSDWAGDHFKSSDEAMAAWWLRLMFVQEQDRDCYIGRGLPRVWLRDGETAAIRRTVTYFGVMSASYHSFAAQNRIVMRLDPPLRQPPERILVRFRHPEKRIMQEVRVNAQPWSDFDPDREWVILPPMSESVDIEARY